MRLSTQDGQMTGGDFTVAVAVDVMLAFSGMVAWLHSH